MKKWHLVTTHGSFEIEAVRVCDDGADVAFMCDDDKAKLVACFAKSSIIGYHRMDMAARAEESGPTPGPGSDTGQ